MIKVKATREGLMGKLTASGYIIDDLIPFVALPSRKALGKFVRVTNPLNGKSVIAMVLDVGPWNVNDDDYVLNGARPQVESGLTDKTGRPDNNAGIDLGEKVWHSLNMVNNSEVAWEFIDA